MVDGCRCRRGNHIRGAGAYRRRTGDNFATVILLCKRCRRVRHPLFVFALIHGQVSAVGVERFPEPANNAVTENGENAVYEFGFFAVKGHILIIQKFDEGLCGCHDCHKNASLFLIE